MNQNSNQTSTGLGTIATFKADVTGLYDVAGTITLPTVINGGVQPGQAPSALVVVVNKNGSPAYTGFAGAEGFFAQVYCAATDVLTVVLSSSAPVDQGLNVIKTTVSMSEAS